MAKFAAYDPQTARTIAKYVSEQLRQSPAPRRQDTPIHRDARIIRWAKATTSPDYPTYPTSGNVFVAQLGDYLVDDTATVEPEQTVDRTFTEYGTSDSDYVVVVALDGLPPENDVVRIELHDGQWYHRTDPHNQFAATFYHNGANQWITSGGSAANHIDPATTCSARFDRCLYSNWTGGSSDNVIESLSATQSAYTDAAFRIYEPGAWFAAVECHVSPTGDWLEGSGADYTTGTTSGGHSYDYYNGFRCASEFELMFYQRINAGAWASSFGCSFTDVLEYSPTTSGLIPGRVSALLGPFQLGSYTTDDVIELRLLGTLTPAGSHPATEGLGASVSVTFLRIGSETFSQSF